MNVGHIRILSILSLECILLTLYCSLTTKSRGQITICDNYAVFKVFISKCKSKIFAEL